MRDDDECGAFGGMKIARETEVPGKTCPNTTLSTTDPTCLELGSKAGRRGEEPANNRLTYGTASFQIANASGNYANITVGFSLLSLPSSMGNLCGGGVEYLHRDPASRKRRRNGAKKGRAIA
jgi:hypothetical protein